MSDPDPRLREALNRRAARFAPSRSRQRNHRVAAGAVALSVFAGVAGGLWLVASGRDPRPPEPPPPAQKPLVISLGNPVLGMAVDRNAVWVAVHTAGEPGERGGEILRVD